MPTVNYFLRSKGEFSPIYVRIRDGRGVDIKTPTGFIINPSHWSDKKGEVKHTADFKDKLNLTNKLKGLYDFLWDHLSETRTEGKRANYEWLIQALDIFFNRVKDQTTLFTHLMEQKKIALSERILKPSAYTLKCYDTTIQRLKKYEQHKKKVLHLQDIDLSFHSDYTKFAKNELCLSINSIGKDFKQIKTVCFDAKDKGLQINEQSISKSFNAPTERTKFVTLSELELQSIKKFTGPDYLVNAKDWLIIGCWTGCRIGDLTDLTTQKIIKTKEGIEYIKYIQHKTKKTIIIPMHKDVKEIIDRLNGFPREISDVNFNKYIKEVCKRVGLDQTATGSKIDPETKRKTTGEFPKWQLIKSHTCRRSFATNHYNSLPNKTIMAVTGHSTERQFLEYIGEQENQHLDEFHNVWEKETGIIPLNAASL